MTLYIRHTRNSTEDRCKDCLAKPATLLRYGNLTCQPWKGDFDWDNMVCLKNGKPYLVGERVCGHADCVNKKHVVEQRVDGYLIQEVVRRELKKTNRLITMSEATKIVKRRMKNVAQ